MPSLVAFNRRWSIGSDDLALPFLLESLIRLTWLVTLAGLSIWHYSSFPSCATLLWWFMVAAQVLFAVEVVLNGVVSGLSLRGTITQDRPRRHIAKILYVRMALLVPEIGLQVVGTVWAVDPPFCLPSLQLHIFQAAVVVGWTMLLATLIIVVLLFNPTGRVKRLGEDTFLLPLTDSDISRGRDKWETRLGLLCCCFRPFQDSKVQNKYSDVARLFAWYFEDVDVVATDLAAGLILLQHRQKSMQPQPLPTIEESSPPWMTPDQAAHYVKYAVGCYGWPQYLFTSCLPGCCLLATTQCGVCCHPHPSMVVEDNCCLWNTTAMKEITGLPEEDLLYVSFHNSVYQVPFYVALDHGTRSVVLAIRGTLSLQDAMTDLTVQSEKMTMADGTEIWAHRGMALASCWVLQKLQESGVLETAQRRFPNYRLVVTGHSLGAGTAALVAIQLHSAERPVYCFCYAPPGGLLSPASSRACKDIIMSVVLGDDVVPRLSVPHMAQLKWDLLDCLASCNQPKYKILLYKFFPPATTPRDSSESWQLSEPLLASLHIPLNMATQLQSLADIRGETLVCPPGWIYYVTQEEERYSGQWITPEYLNKIIISPKMLLNHLPSTMLTSLTHMTAATPTI